VFPVVLPKKIAIDMFFPFQRCGHRVRVHRPVDLLLKMNVIIKHKVELCTGALTGAEWGTEVERRQPLFER
jgi:hypothetical protein